MPEGVRLKPKQHLIYLAWLALAASCLHGCSAPKDPVDSSSAHLPALTPFENRPVEDDVIYFLITDRFENGDPANDQGGIDGGKLEHGYDPRSEMFYHGGDLQGVARRLDYLEELGVTAIWITPVFDNLPVQTFGEWTTASYHGYWIADFMSVDPHLGSEEDLRTLIDEAHKRDIKIILDIVINHTAHVIKYRECHDPNYTGPGKEGPASACIYRGTDNYPDHAYTPYIDEQNLAIKNPAWLNDLTYYHNRGELDYTGESFYWGDFSGLDDVFTEHPRVIEGMIEIYQYWVSEFGIDGFRIDTAGHINNEFFSDFSPAIRKHAAANGRPEFMMFGEVVDSVLKKRGYVTKGGLPAILDFDFQDAVVDYTVNSGSAADLASFFRDGDYFIDHDTSPYQLPTFLGNHDLGRFGVFLRKADPDADDETNLQRSILAHAILYFARGIPILYYGDEQGFITDPGFHESREDMFPSVTPMYNANDLIGTDHTTADDNFDREHPLYREIQQLTKIYRDHPTLRRGDQVTRFAEDGAGVFAFSRIDPNERVEYLVLVNNDQATASAIVPTSSPGAEWDLIAGNASEISQEGDHVAVTVAPLSYVVYRADKQVAIQDKATSISFTNIDNGDVLNCSGFVEATPDDSMTNVEFSIAVGNNDWRSLGIDRDPPFRTYLDIEEYLPDSEIVLRAKTVAYTVEPADVTLDLRIGTHQEHCQ
jgi:glycosidase